jgi:uncharacterized protein YkwD
MIMDRGIRTAAAPARRATALLYGVIALAVLAGGGLYLARGVFLTPAAGTSASSAVAVPADVAVAVSPAVVTIPPHRTAAGSSSASARTSSPGATGSATGAASTRPAAASSAQAGTSSPAEQGSTAAGQVLALINQARAAAGLPALAISSGLESSSAAHNQLMAGGCGLSHQCPGEPALGDRETAAGVIWTAAGENIGEGGPVASTNAAIAQMAVSLTQSMLNEQPPNDGHRMNILSSAFTHIGIAVYRDGSGTVWLTQDFSN